MNRTNYTEEYRKIAKKAGGNVVSSVSSALKKLDAEKNPEKIAALTEPAKKALLQAIADLKPLEMDSKVAGKARALGEDLKKLLKEVDGRHKTALVEVKTEEAEEEVATAPGADKSGAVFTKEITTLDDALVKQLQLCSARQKDVWTAVEKFSDKRWKCIKSFAKGFDASTNGFRGFPFAIAMMVEEVGSKEESEKGIKGSVQTVGMDVADDKVDTNKVKSQFINYSKNEVKSELQALVKDLDELDDAFGTVGKSADKAQALVDKIAKQVKTPKVGTECAKLKGAVENLNKTLDKAGKSVMLLMKKVQKDGGLGEEDAEFRDAYQEIPALPVDAVHKVLVSLKAQL